MSISETGFEQTVETMEACPICCNDFNRVTRKPVECNYCHSQQCTECIKTYMLGTLDDPSCMQCKHPWTLDFVETYLPKTWLRKDLQKHRAEILYEREKAMLPETQLILEDQRNSELRRFLLEVAASADKLETRIDKEYIPAEIVRLIDIVNQQFEVIPRVLNRNLMRGSSEPEFIRNCPVDGCRGFIRNKTWCCGMCQVKLCSKCEVVLDGGEGQGNHVCNPQTLETIKVIKRDSKPCPSCKALIFKIDGCDQMWCIQCKTAFSWTSGRIETGRIHNPEYYRWMREQNNGVVPREPGDGGCIERVDHLPYAHRVNRLCEEMESKNRVMKIHMQLEHITWLCTNTRVTIERNANNHDLRVSFLKKKISDDDFKTKLQRKEKMRRHKQAYLDIYNLLMTVGIQAFHQFVIDLNPHNLFKTITEICNYCEEQVHKINNQFLSNSYEAFATIRKLLE